MILVLIRMNALSEKRMELSQTIASLSDSIRKENGCRRCDFCRSVDDENRLFLIEEWDTKENLITYLKSEHFRVLRGAMNLLREPHEMIIHAAFNPAEWRKFNRGSDDRDPEKEADPFFTNPIGNIARSRGKGIHEGSV